MPANIYAPSPRDGLEAQENQLYRSINRYRANNGLAPIPASRALTLVANRHVLDLEENVGFLTHGWSDVPYDASNPDWSEPQRFNTGYPGNGYENASAMGGGFDITVAAAFGSWQGSVPHRNTILNRDIWSDNQWNALGVGIYGSYAVIWFGEEVDPTGVPGGVRAGILTGSNSAETLQGSALDDVITGLGGNDTLVGNLGNDIIGGGTGRDNLLGGNGNDALFGEGGNDRLVGHFGNDRLLGGAGNDRLIGSAGHDVLVGGGGRNVLVGGAGRDRFVLQTGSSIDVIQDFQDRVDRIGLPRGVGFQNLSFSRSGNVLSVSAGDDILAWLVGVGAGQLSAADFR